MLHGALGETGCINNESWNTEKNTIKMKKDIIKLQEKKYILQHRCLSASVCKMSMSFMENCLSTFGITD